MRGIHTRKRSNPNGGPFRRFKRRRLGRRRRFSGRRTSSLSTRSLAASSAFAFRGRKLRRGAWRRHIYRDTLTNTHFRSINTRLTVVTTPGAVTDVAPAAITCFDVTVPFWKRIAAFNQGLQYTNIEAGVLTVPSWGVVGNPHPEKVVVRGGRFFISANCQSIDDPVNVRIQLVFPKQQASSNAGGAGNTLASWVNQIIALTPLPISWTFQQAADYDSYFYPPIMDKTFRLKPGDDIMLVKKIKPMVIDTAVWLRQGGWFPYWMVYCSQSATNIAGNPPVGYVTGTNLSFSVTQENT